ncbi:ankyrin [Rhizodiscina lignyota]|uniref:Ankyrin n=1 Tax=Rhizodiscina lignyota TaxID=1504668 RepID=A0A9P4I2S6_9PEZI|nr:ankyrin [Rhizodiscina lignyota]
MPRFKGEHSHSYSQEKALNKITLDTLPYDILDLLALHMNKSNLLNLRYVSRRFNAIFIWHIFRELIREIRDENKTHLHNAIAKCHHGTIENLLGAGAPVNSTNRAQNDELPLHVAARNNCIFAIRELLRYGATIDAQNRHGWTPLQLAARYGHIQTLRELVAADANVNQRGFHGWTALHYSIRSGHADVTKALLEAGANQEIRDNDGRTATDGMKGFKL